MKRAASLLALLPLLVACEGMSLFGKSQPKHAAAVAPPAAGSAVAAARDPMFPDLVAFAPTNHPAGSCVTEDELVADQFIRLHTEMMVAGLTCQGAYGDPGLFTKYAEFTRDHQDRVRDSQSVLADFLGKYMSGNQNRLFDTYRTEMANDESQLVIDVSAGRYCQAMRDKFYAAADFGTGDLDSYLDEALAHYRSKYQVCGETPSDTATDDTATDDTPASASESAGDDTRS